MNKQDLQPKQYKFKLQPLTAEQVYELKILKAQTEKTARLLGELLENIVEEHS